LPHQCLTIDDSIAMMGPNSLRELAKFAADAANRLDEIDGITQAERAKK
jgi:hypothetical protein